ncbi:MAG TPA: hypothetical protein VGK29_00315 [Paludibaculum sp.]|jgi:hypothetical protein
MKYRPLFRALYEASLWAYPPRFRERFGPEMMQLFDDRYSSIVQSSGSIGLIRFAAQLLTDLVWAVLRESIDSLQPDPQPVIAADFHFTLLGDQTPGPKSLAAGAVASIALFGMAVVAMEHWRGPNWRGDLYTSASAAPRLSGGGLASLPASGLGSSPASEQTPAGSRSSILDDLVGLFDIADVVALGEFHGSLEDAALRQSLLHHPDFPKKVRYVMVEFANSLHQDILNRYIQGGDVQPAEIQKVWRDITTPGGADSPVYAQFFDEVRAVNLRLPDNLKLRVLAGDPPLDWSVVKTREDWRRVASTRDAFAAGLLSREVLEKGEKALVIFGAGHIWRNAAGGPIPAGSTLVPLLDRQYRGRIYTVLPIRGGSYPNSGRLESAPTSAQRPILLILKGSPIGALDPNEFVSGPFNLPFRMFPSGITMDDVADACVYRGTAPDLPVNAAPAAAENPAYDREKARRKQLLAPPIPGPRPLNAA